MNLEVVQSANTGDESAENGDETEEERLQARRDVLRILRADKSEKEGTQAIEEGQTDNPDKNLEEGLKFLEQRRRSEKPKTLYAPKPLEDIKAVFDASEAIRDELAELDSIRPQTRAECSNVPRPCPLAGCKYNNYLDVNPATGTITLNHLGLTPDQMPPAYSCALDVADRHHGEELPQNIVGIILNLSRNRVGQIEDESLSGCTELRHG
ncbi:MAG: hypothetical protein AAB739_04900 [Patescibacteria group bacterium]